MQSFIIQAAARRGPQPARSRMRSSSSSSLVVFGLLFFAISKWVVPNFEKTFADRTAAIEGGLAAAETKQAEADAKLAELEAAARRRPPRGRADPRGGARAGRPDHRGDA